MDKCFNKAIAFTDLHVGYKGDSQTFNQDCIDYTEWLISEGKKANAETCIFMGDFFHVRSRVNVFSLNVGLSIIEKIASSFDNFYFLVGNHDMYYRDRRDVVSTNIGRHIPNLTLIDEITTVGDTTFVPWLIKDEWKEIKNIDSKYVFGHFDMPNFMMNAMVVNPDHGQPINANSFEKSSYVFSGHFHKRQQNKNVIYIGNAFPHNFADVGDDDRGCMILENDKEPVFLNWEDCPKYRVVNLSDLLDNSDKLASFIPKKSYIRIIMDTDLQYEEATMIKNVLTNTFSAREVELRPQAKQIENDEDWNNVSFRSVDQMVTEGLMSVESTTISPQKLIQIWQEL
ncbi:MAG: metallophosphoesterase [Candidimonas sp.]